MSSVFERAQSVIVEQLSVNIEEVTEKATFSDLGADSLDTVELVMAFEEEFGIDIPDEDAEGIDNIEEVVELIKSKMSEGVK
uniref:acyl carrier protein n=1 Tax=Gracilaria flabelliformis subsp. simplex TaxID=1638138 RepID=UPI001D1196B2|nr:acyl carrier protein [Gracilaria flabelliformis subsp. simplex]UAD86031.1 acyl carrier protein [Gracilaria flabelliformis subsp. simplex]